MPALTLPPARLPPPRTPEITDNERNRRPPCRFRAAFMPALFERSLADQARRRRLTPHSCAVCRLGIIRTALRPSVHLLCSFEAIAESAVPRTRRRDMISVIVSTTPRLLIQWAIRVATRSRANASIKFISRSLRRSVSQSRPLLQSVLPAGWTLTACRGRDRWRVAFLHTLPLPREGEGKNKWRLRTRPMRASYFVYWLSMIAA